MASTYLIVEHLIFLGSKNYGGRQDLRDLFSKYGGETNGVTEKLYTYFHYYCDQATTEAVEVTLAAFADSLFNPSMKDDVIRNEVDNVDSEHAMKRNDVMVRGKY